jgi:hypothetical protein
MVEEPSIKAVLARAIAPYLDIERNCSPSFRAFVRGVRRVVEGPAWQGGSG